MKALKFYDLKTRKAFMSSNYTFMLKRNPKYKRINYFAVTTNPSGKKAYRIISKKTYLGK